jgi:hypothetical protein
MAQRGKKCDDTGKLPSGYQPVITGFNTNICQTIFETRLASKHFCIMGSSATCHDNAILKLFLHNIKSLLI